MDLNKNVCCLFALPKNMTILKKQITKTSTYITVEYFNFQLYYANIFAQQICGEQKHINRKLG